MLTTVAQPLRRLFVESDMEVPEIIDVTSGHVAVFCRRCPSKIEPNDDSAAMIQTVSGGIVMVVADGVGGCPLGYKASAIAVESVIESVHDAAPLSDLRPAILDGIERANDEILDLGIGAATTLAVVEIQDRVARAYQVGDSMTLMIGQRGALKWKSTPHSPVGYAIESGMLDEADAMHHDERHLVSNLVGSRSMHIEIGPARTLAAKDTVIVGSDGLFDNLHVREVIDMARSGKPIRRITSLADLATRRMTDPSDGQPGKPDDLAILIYSP
ncbi:MAG: protein phosphatase 2C domain-containing protein [Rubripirellula sp.]